MPLTPGDYISYVRERARALNLDPGAVLAVAAQEGLGGEDTSLVPGDNGTSFGPHQLHANGALPANIWAQGPQAAQAWAWSTEGFDYALNLIAKVAGGLRGTDAIVAITSKFEIPSRDYGPFHRDLQAEEIQHASAAYNAWSVVAGSPGDSTLPAPGTISGPAINITPGAGSTAGGGTGSTPTTSLDFGASVQHVLISVGLIALAFLLIIGGIVLLASGARR